MRKMKHGLILLLAGLVLLVLSGCSQPKQVGTRSMAGVADLIASMSSETVVTTDSSLDSGTAAAAYFLLNNSNLVNGEEKGELASKLQETSCTERYSALSAPTESGETRMSRLFIFPGDWSEDEVARSIVDKIDEMAMELPSTSRQVVIDSYFTYTYTYSVSVRQAFSDKASAWVVGIGINQTAKEEHKT